MSLSVADILKWNVLRPSGGGGSGGVSVAQAAAQVANGGYDRGTVSAADVNAQLAGPSKFYFLPPGVTTVTGQIQLVSGSTIMGCGQSSVLRMAAGGSIKGAVITNALTSDGGVTWTMPGSTNSANITLKGFTVDGNNAAAATLTSPAGKLLGSPGGGLLRTAGIYLLRCPGLTVENVQVANVAAYKAFCLDGNDGTSSFDARVAQINNVACFDNVSGVASIDIGGTFRQVELNNVVAYDNRAAIGVFLDVSEMKTSNVVSRNNTGHGIKINNVFNCSYDGLVAFNNGFDGIVVEEMVASRGGQWSAWGNGWNAGTYSAPSAQVSGNGWAEVRFNNSTDQGYGITKNCTVSGINLVPQVAVTGATGSPWNYRWADYGLYVEDGVINDMNLLQVHLGESGHLARYRIPANSGDLRIVMSDGSQVPASMPSVTNLFFADPAMVAGGSAATNWSAQAGTLAFATFNGVPVLELTSTADTAHTIFTKTAADVPVTPGQYLRWSVEVACDAMWTDVSIGGTWMDASHVAIASGSVMSAVTKQTTRGLARYASDENKAFTSLTTIQVPAGAAFFRPKVSFLPQVSSGSTGLKMRITKIMVIQSPDVHPLLPANYVDGDVPGCTWTGTARASTSTRLATLSAAAALSHGEANLASDVAVTANTVTTIMTMTFPTAGVYQVNTALTVTEDATSTQVESRLAFGTAAGSIVGGAGAGVQAATLPMTISGTAVVTVTTPGTVVLQARSGTGFTASAATSPTAWAGATSYNWRRIA